LIGTTPINDLPVARGEYLLRVEKDAYAAFERTISSKLTHSGTAMVPPDDPTRVHQRLIETAKMPARMVFVPGDKYKLVSWRKPTNAGVALDDYFLDAYEVSNREYKEFILAGGYQKREYWTHPFVKAGRPLSWEEAVANFKDRTGLAGPREWAAQSYGEGKADHPVTGITWYEAAAYAAFRGKRLPTIFQWEKAARNGLFTYNSAYIMPWGPIDLNGSVEGRANFKSGGTAPVGQFEFGISPFGCHDMAGNVAEWCSNETSQGFVTAGASWDDQAYLFPYIGELPGFNNSNKLGFRCAMPAGELRGDQGAMKFETTNPAPVYWTVSDAEFQPLLGYYRYDASPLDARVGDVTETGEWRREKITYLGAQEERAIAYLYLPKTAAPPFQVIQFVPAGDVYGGFATMAESVEMLLTPYIRSGRAVLAVVFKGFKERERRPGYVQAPSNSVKRREEWVNNATDLRRGLDYLATRTDVDSGRIAYFGFSQGATEGIIYAALDARYKSVVLMAGGMWPLRKDVLPEIAHSNFAPRIRAPKLLLNGRYDEVHPLTTLVEPFYNLLREPKKLVLYDGSHTPPIETAVPAINGWLDETLGSVRR
jgi:formylglycine-generating enzyme required for sulfatase activity/predicted esterase